jgi:hypothetical protein
MTNVSDTLRNPQAGSDMAPLRAKWGWIVALGVVYLLAGLVALGSVVMATVASVLVVGVMMIIAGVAEVVSAFQIKSWGRFLLWVLLGVLYIVGGFVAFENPLLAAALVTLILGATAKFRVSSPTAWGTPILIRLGRCRLKASGSARRTGYSQPQRGYSSQNTLPGVQGRPCFLLAAPSRSLLLLSPREYLRCAFFH